MRTRSQIIVSNLGTTLHFCKLVCSIVNLCHILMTSSYVSLYAILPNLVTLSWCHLSSHNLEILCRCNFFGIQSLANTACIHTIIAGWTLDTVYNYVRSCGKMLHLLNFLTNKSEMFKPAIYLIEPWFATLL